jgi:hypothetical protein
MGRNESSLRAGFLTICMRAGLGAQSLRMKRRTYHGQDGPVFLWIVTRAADYDAGTQGEQFPQEFHLRVIKRRKGDLQA